ncbi:MAG: nickel pincer cofactor biosynthesis protein LarB [Chloroflexi bacterium]|nr:nickel pincer cofactor biosynthesis protein LarB [Chloroflexota bacterium]MCH8115382.1 nickel pincer cofactor biosynthesis protein LarB [Chloroflexota bacterium]MCI0804145.1 nickel pincer cofactor biosynthesis protein LarB [Chloroflexota bacterium]MCI0834203.1 nickel pincer cofactor biosynthesis protein LarB [Chloroflexota bacterium]MCI0836999.1 nickel pincer cofactor biosynthesis protein LarB [Chloroflexota bacterium]
MNNSRLLEVLKLVSEGEMSADRAASELSLTTPPADLEFATLDHDRNDRIGFPEVVYGLSKTPKDTAEIAIRIYEHAGVVLVTKSSEEAFELIQESVAGAVWEEGPRAIWADRRPEAKKRLVPGVAVVAAGTSDLPIAREAVLTATLMGCDVIEINDVGVAGLHRLSHRMDDLVNARVIVVVAGMEGALPSVIGGLVRAPVIALPTSVGYGASLGGVAALLAMLNSCAPGVSVVNIDNGFGAGYQAASIVGATWGPAGA